MRIRYCRTISLDVTRFASSAAFNSGIVASTTENGFAARADVAGALFVWASVTAVAAITAHTTTMFFIGQKLYVRLPRRDDRSVAWEEAVPPDGTGGRHGEANPFQNVH